MSRWRMATHPSVGVKPGLAMWKKIADPQPLFRMRMFQSITTQMS